MPVFTYPDAGRLVSIEITPVEANAFITGTGAIGYLPGEPSSIALENGVLVERHREGVADAA